MATLMIPMSSAVPAHALQSLLIAYVATAKSELSTLDFQKIELNRLRNHLILLLECVPLSVLLNKVMIRHSLQQHIKGASSEENIMHSFVLYIFQLIQTGSNHPLERGIIRQKIQGILPVFAAASQRGLMVMETFEKNADALLQLADNRVENPALLAALAEEYNRYAD